MTQFVTHINTNDWIDVASLDAQKVYKLNFTPLDTAIVEIHLHAIQDNIHVSRINAPGSKFIKDRRANLKFRTTTDSKLCIWMKSGEGIKDIEIEEIEE